jgi:hypothetical protein
MRDRPRETASGICSRVLAPLGAALAALGAGCGPGVTCGGSSPNFAEQPLQSGKTVAVSAPRASTTLFYPIAVPRLEVGTVLNVNIEDDPEGGYKVQCAVIRGFGKREVVWYCQTNRPFTAQDFHGGKSVPLPGGNLASLLPCETTNLAWNKGGVSYSVYGDPLGYTPEDIVAIGKQLAQQDADPSVPKVGRVVHSVNAAEVAYPH